MTSVQGEHRAGFIENVIRKTHLPLLENQISNIWSMGKDDHSYLLARQTPCHHGGRIANHKGHNPQERASLKKRLLRKSMSTTSSP